jgi:hypothetical protein
MAADTDTDSAVAAAATDIATTATTGAVVAATRKMRLLIQAVAVVEMVVLALGGLVGACVHSTTSYLHVVASPDQGGRPMLQTATTVIPLQQQTVDSTGGQDDEGRDLASPHNACSSGHTNANTRNTPRRRIRLHLVLQIEWARLGALISGVPNVVGCLESMDDRNELCKVAIVGRNAVVERHFGGTIDSEGNETPKASWIKPPGDHSAS